MALRVKDLVLPLHQLGSCRVGSIPGPRTSICYRCSQKKKIEYCMREVKCIISFVKSNIVGALFIILFKTFYKKALTVTKINSN